MDYRGGSDAGPTTCIHLRGPDKILTNFKEERGWRVWGTKIVVGGKNMVWEVKSGLFGLL